MQLEGTRCSSLLHVTYMDDAVQVVPCTCVMEQHGSTPERIIERIHLLPLGNHLKCYKLQTDVSMNVGGFA